MGIGIIRGAAALAAGGVVGVTSLISGIWHSEEGDGIVTWQPSTYNVMQSIIRGLCASLYLSSAALENPSKVATFFFKCLATTAAALCSFIVLGNMLERTSLSDQTKERISFAVQISADALMLGLCCKNAKPIYEGFTRAAGQALQVAKDAISRLY